MHPHLKGSVTTLKFLNFEQEALHFHVVLGPENDVASSEWTLHFIFFAKLPHLREYLLW